MNNVVNNVLSFEEHSTKIRKNNSTFSSSENDYVISDNKPNQIKASRETISDFQITDPKSNKNLMNAVYDGKVKEGENMSDDIAKTVGRLEANYEHMLEHQQKLEASIEAMPKKITDELSKQFTQELKNQITTLNADITVKIGKVQSDLDVKIAGFETKIERNAKENNRWVIGIILTAFFFGITYFTSQIDKKIESFVKSDNKNNSQPTVIMMPYNNQPQIMEQQQKQETVEPSPSPQQEKDTP
jgi:hypothetical protein